MMSLSGDFGGHVNKTVNLYALSTSSLGALTVLINNREYTYFMSFGEAREFERRIRRTRRPGKLVNELKRYPFERSKP